LAKRLKSIRDGVKGDAIRFSSGQYPFSVRSVNRNDPRNRADSVCDVTVLGNPIPWDTHARGEASLNHRQSSQQRLMTALCYVHSWTFLNAARTDIDSKLCEMKGEELAWIVFAYDTAHEQNLVKGSQLRIYNSVLIPAAGTKSSGESKGDEAVTAGVNWIVMCSQRCEAYPSSVLSPLPDVSSVASQAS
jgi:hypothetical protein